MMAGLSHSSSTDDCAELDELSVVINTGHSKMIISNLIIDVCDVHNIVDMETKVVGQYSAQDVKCDVGSEWRNEGQLSVTQSQEALHLAWPMWAASYTVGPQLYHVTVGGTRGLKSSLRRVRVELELFTTVRWVRGERGG